MQGEYTMQGELLAAIAVQRSHSGTLFLKNNRVRTTYREPGAGGIEVARGPAS